MIGKINTLLLNITNEIDSLIDSLYVSTPENILLTPLPTFKKLDEIQSIDEILVETKQGQLLEEVRVVFKQFYAIDLEHSSKITQKFPGVIIMLPEAYQKISQHIEQINTYKMAFKQCYLDATRSNRFQQLHDAFPGLITLQVTRNIPYNPPYLAMKTLKFYWHKNVITKPITKSDILAKFYRTLGNIDENPILTIEQRLLEKEKIVGHIEIVNSLPRHAKLRLNRSPLIPSPAINTRVILDDGTSKTFNEKSSLPKFIFNQPEKMNTLTNFVLKAETSNRAGKSNYRAVIEEIGLEIHK